MDEVAPKVMITPDDFGGTHKPKICTCGLDTEIANASIDRARDLLGFDGSLPYTHDHGCPKYSGAQR
jgi:hypothetical protein